MVETLTFEADAALFEELGERLVGKHSVAFGELIKNAYDADATEVEVLLDPQDEGLIVIEDNGHGMSFEEFSKFWMRVGSTHKRDQERSRNLDRPLTGSKGVGRISARLLSHEIRIETVSEKTPREKLVAKLDWRDVKEVEDLRQVEVEYEMLNLDQPAKPGTRIELRNLKTDWTTDRIRDVAREIWQLQPPFRGPSMPDESDPEDFQVDFQSPEPELVEEFQKQMEVILELDHARLTGRLTGEELEVSMVYEGERLGPLSQTIEGSTVDHCEFEIRFYQLKGRQPHGIKVAEAREYVREHGGVHIYDAGFRLPYYGEIENDWLGLTLDHARRIESAELLPEDMTVPGAMTHLPHMHHLIGVVKVNTSNEPELEVTITRDRLQDTDGFDAIRRAVRLSLEWYATEKAKRRLAETQEKLDQEETADILETVDEILAHYEAELPKQARDDLKAAIDQAIETARDREEAISEQVAVLSSLATAGISSLAFQHEIKKQVGAVGRVAERLRGLAADYPEIEEDVRDLEVELNEWRHRMETVASVLGHLQEGENVKDEGRFNAERVARQAFEQVHDILPSMQFETRFEGALTLPKATYAEWISVFQNVYFNAANAMMDNDERRLVVQGRQDGRLRRIQVLDNGVGIDLDEAQHLFEPFERAINISEERRNLGFGGTGMGLTIVRTIARRRNCEVQFVEPPDDYSTAFQLSWRVED